MRSEQTAIAGLATLVAIMLAGLASLAGCGSGGGGGGPDAPVDAGAVEGGPSAGERPEPGPPVRGRLLQAGTDLADPYFVMIDGRRAVTFRTPRATPERGPGAVDVHVVWDDGTGHRVAFEGRSPRAEWPEVADADGARFFMSDERSTPLGPVGTLHRVSLTEGSLESIPDVLGYTLGTDRRTFHYRRYLPGSLLPELHLRDLAGRDRNLGRLSGAVVALRAQTLYFVAEAERTLTRVSGFETPVAALRAQVTRFQVTANDAHAILQVSEAGGERTVVHDLAAGLERPLPVAMPCCWLGVQGTTFTFADSARPDRPAELHLFDLVSGTDRVTPLPVGLADVVSMLTRPPASRGERLLQDSQGRLALLRADGRGELLAPAMHAPRFTDDGRWLLFVEQERGTDPPAGPLFVRDADDWTRPPLRLSPAGVRVPSQSSAFVLRSTSPGALAFWTTGPDGSDLYLADLLTGESSLVASRIGSISLSENHLVGLVNLDERRLGDLVVQNLITKVRFLIERGVAATDVQSDAAVFVVRDATPESPRNGLWLAPLPAPLP